MNKLTDIELEFLRKEASKLDGLDFLKRFINNFWGKIPMPGTIEDLKDFTIKDKNKYINDHKKWTQTFKKAIKLVGKVEIEILEEGTYETGKKEVKKEYGIKTSIFSKENKEEDQIFINQTFKGGVNYQLTFYIENLLREKLKDYREQSKKKPLFKSSGHLRDQMLKKIDLETSVFDLFSTLEEDTKRELEREKTEITSELFSGINLTASEMKIQDVFSILLSEQSQIEDPNKPNYYTGIQGKKQSSYLGGVGTIAPTIEFSLYKIAKEFKGGKTPTGRDLENVSEILKGLEKKEFLIQYTETHTDKKGNQAILKREGKRKLFEIWNDSITIKDKEGNELNKAKTITIVLSPIYREQIATKFILQPVNIIQQLTIANGSPNIPLATYNLKDYCFRELSYSHYEFKITARKLFETLEPKLMKAKRRKEAQINTTRAIETLKSLGLLEKYELTKSKVGDDMYIFYLNKKYL